jgi:hypothetical protein
MNPDTDNLRPAASLEDELAYWKALAIAYENLSRFTSQRNTYGVSSAQAEIERLRKTSEADYSRQVAEDRERLRTRFNDLMDQVEAIRYQVLR